MKPTAVCSHCGMVAGSTKMLLAKVSGNKNRKLVVITDSGGVQEETTVNGALVFVTASIENIPSGWRARETYTFLGPDVLEEVFELAPPGKPFELYSRARLKRLQ